MTRPITQGPYRTFRRLNPNDTFLEYEGSTITIPMKGRRSPKDPWLEDELRLKAFMRLEIFPAYINNLGTREFQFIIRDWYLYGKSPMLNELFLGDPRGRFLEQQGDYAPIGVTFNVSHNYDVSVFGASGLTARQVFAEPSRLELRNLTSHHLRSWIDVPELSDRPTYSLIDNIIYWRVIPAGDLALKEKGVQSLLGKGAEGPVIVFHKKPPGRDARGLAEDAFDLRQPRDRAAHLVAIGVLGDEKTADGLAAFIAREPMPSSGQRLRVNEVQLPGDTVLSPLYRARQPLEVRWAFAEGVAPHDLAATHKEKGLSGAIRIVSPARSLGTADQAPDLGEDEDSADFPARITYAINYDIALNREVFVRDQAGVAIAVGAQAIPPRDVIVAFEKPHMGRVLQSYLEFKNGWCTGMEEITLAEYQSGVNFARYWRTAPLRDEQWTGFADYDPAVTY